MSNQTPILIVDDNQINCQYFSMSLKKIFSHVDVAEGGLSAIDHAKRNNYALILMDIRMPDMDGYETTKNIRLIENHKDTIIIATSAEDINSKKKELFDDFISKPIRPKQLQNILLKYAGNNLNIFNQETVLKYAYHDKEIVEKIIAMFISELPIQLNNLDQALAEGNNELCLEVLHKLRGSCQTCGAEKLNNECENLSHAIKSNAMNTAFTSQSIHKAAQKFIRLFQ